MDAAIQTVPVSLGSGSYAIDVGSGLLPDAPALIRAHLDLQRVFLITDEHVRWPHAERVGQLLREAGVAAELLTVAPGEPSKSIGAAAALWESLLEGGADRASVVIAVGGGVVGDLAGFVAATYARGIRLVQIPTSLLAQVDSSVGGKVGINLPQAKNMVGAFWQPSYVLVDIDVLQTLPDREYRAGLAEVVKYGVILDADLFACLEANVDGLNQHRSELLASVIARCCQLKADVVRRDERELSGARAVLNYGHTFAHALEAVSGYGQLLHGEAVAIGMLCASRLAESLGHVDAAFTRRQAALLTALGLPVAVPEVDRAAVVAAMRYDKKVAHGRLRFVLPLRLGQVALVEDVDPALVRAALEC